MEREGTLRAPSRSELWTVYVDHMTRATRAILVLPLIAGCYVYRPVTSAAPAGQDRVRFTLTDSGAVVLASELGPATEEVSGRVVQESAGAYVLSVLATRRRGGAETDWRGEQVVVPRILVARTEERRFSRKRTGIAIAGVIVAAVVAREAVWGPGGAFGGAPAGGGPGPR
jgi:hypothetical protein